MTHKVLKNNENIIKRRKRLFNSAAAALVVVIGSVFAWYVSSDTVTNTFASGKLDIQLYETKYKSDGKKLLPEEEIGKNPSVCNTGTLAEYAFLRVSVPVENLVRLEDAENYASVTDKYYEIYKFTTTEGSGSAGPVSRNITVKTSVSSTDADGVTTVTEGEKTVEIDENFAVFAYNDSENAWQLISAEYNKETKCCDYVFGLKKILASGEMSKELFSKVALRHFVESQLLTDEPERYISVEACAIQTDYVSDSVRASDFTGTQEQLRTIYAQYKNIEGVTAGE